MICLYPEGVLFQSPGSRRSRAPWESDTPSLPLRRRRYTNRLVQPLWGRCREVPLTQGGAAAPLTLGFGIKPLRGIAMKAHGLENPQKEQNSDRSQRKASLKTVNEKPALRKGRRTGFKSI